MIEEIHEFKIGLSGERKKLNKTAAAFYPG